MPHLREYVKRSGYYIRDYVNNSPVTWQVSLRGERELRELGLLVDDTQLPDHVFHDLRERGLLYTGGSGTSPQDNGLAGWVDSIPELRLSFSHTLFITLAAFSLKLEQVRVKHGADSRVELQIGNYIVTGKLEREQFWPDHPHRLTFLSFPANTKTVIVKLNDAVDGRCLAIEKIGLSSAKVQLFKSSRERMPGKIAVAIEELKKEFPRGVCLLIDHDVNPENISVEGAQLNSVHLDWGDRQMLHLAIPNQNTRRILIRTPFRQEWKLVVGKQVELSCAAPMHVECDNIFFRGGEYVIPVTYGQPLPPLCFRNWQNKVTDESTVPMQLVMETGCLLHSWRLGDFEHQLTPLENDTAQLDVEELLTAEKVKLPEGPTIWRLEGDECREDNSVTVFRIPRGLHSPPVRFNERPTLKNSAGEVWFEARRPLQIAGLQENKLVRAEYDVNAYYSLEAAWIPVVVDAVVIARGEVIASGEILTLGHVRDGAFVLLCPAAGTEWQLSLEGQKASHPGRQRLQLSSLFSWDNLCRATDRIRLRALLDNFIEKDWPISLAPDDVAAVGRWCCVDPARQTPHPEYALDISVSWYGFREQTLVLYVLLDGRRFKEANCEDVEDSGVPVFQQRSFRLLLKDAEVREAAGASSAILRISRGKCPLAETPLEHFPFPPPPIGSEELRQEIRTLARALGDDDVNIGQCERFVMLVEQFAAMQRQMPFPVGQLSSAVPDRPGFGIAKDTLLLIDSVVNDSPANVAVPDYAADNSLLWLYFQTLRVFDQAQRVRVGQMVPRRMSQLAATLRAIAPILAAEEHSGWAIIVATYAEFVTRTSMGDATQHPTPLNNSIPVIHQPLLRIYGEFLDWLQKQTAE